MALRMPFNLIPGLILNVVVTMIWGHDIFRLVRHSASMDLQNRNRTCCKSLRM